MSSEQALTVSGDVINAVFWQALEERRELRTLVIWGGPVTNEKLAPLSRLTWLTGVTLGEMPIDDGVFVHLQPLRALTHLNLAYTAIKGDFTPLLGAPLLDLRLEGCRRFGDAGARSLVQFPTLRNLEMHMTGLTDAGLAALAELPLEVLWLGPRITDDGMRTVGGFRALKHLDICTHLLTDQGARQLAHLRDLEVLWVTGSRISDASVELLSGLTKLRELNVNNTEISPQGAAALVRALPSCRMVPPD